MTVPAESKAVVQPDPASTRLEATTLPVPQADARECIVQVYGTSPCLGELGWEKAFPALFKDRKDPGARVPGTEGAGVVRRAPAGSAFAPGQEVMWRNNAWMWGSLRGYTAILEENLAPKPAALSWAEAAATPLSTLTAWDGVFTHAPLDPAGLADAAVREKNGGLRVLVTGASGSVGRWAVRFAALAGAHVVAVGGPEAAAGVLADGAEEYLDYRKDDLAALPEKVQHIFDCTGKDTEKGWAVLEDNGTFVSVCVDPSATKPEGKPVKDAKWFLVEPSGKNLVQISKVIEQHGWKPVLDSVVPFEEFQAAYDKVDSGKARGKVVITVTEDA